jgi:hypothetical protein
VLRWRELRGSAGCVRLRTLTPRLRSCAAACAGGEALCHVALYGVGERALPWGRSAHRAHALLSERAQARTLLLLTLFFACARSRAPLTRALSSRSPAWRRCARDTLPARRRARLQ